MRAEVRALTEALFATGRRETLLVLGAILALALTEWAGLLLLIPLMALLGLDTSGGFSSTVTDTVESSFRWVGLEPTLPMVLGLYVLIMGGRSLVQWYEAVASERLSQRFMHRFRARLYQGIAQVPWAEFTRRKSATFTHVLTNEIDRAGVAIGLLVRLLVDFVVGAVYLGLAMAFSPPLTLLATALALILLAVLHRWNAGVRDLGERLSRLWEELHVSMGENLRGMKTIRSYGAEARSAVELDRISGRVAEVHIRTRASHASVSALFALGAAATLALIVFIGVQIWSLASGLVLMLLYLYARLVPRFAAVQEGYRRLLGEIPAVARVLEMVAWCRDRRETSSTARDVEVAFDRELRLSGVSFSYDGAATVEKVDLTIPAGSWVAFVGRSGSGKTTLADLLAGLLEPSTGEVLVDGQVLDKERSLAWRQRIAYVTQDPFLLHDTVRENLLWAHPGVSDDELERALSMAGAGVTTRLHLDTVVGDQGTRISGGERQRIALARAILRKPKLLILDEPTSALDRDSESAILDTIYGLRGPTTILLITHRVHVVRDADMIHVIDGGGIVRSGTWEEVIETEAPLHRCPAGDDPREDSSTAWASVPGAR